jgi:hypothetical protein
MVFAVPADQLADPLAALTLSLQFFWFLHFLPQVPVYQVGVGFLHRADTLASIAPLNVPQSSTKHPSLPAHKSGMSFQLRSMHFLNPRPPRGGQH